MERNNIKENQEVILPLGNHVTCAWPETNFLISILQTKRTGWDWVMNSHIQLRAADYVNHEKDFKDMRITFYPYGMHDLTPSIYDLCPFIDKYVITRDIVKNKYDSFVCFVEEYINEGFYISTYLNQFFRMDMRSQEYYHPAYIYGYNRDLGKIYLVDCFENGKYMSKEISYLDMELAFGMVLESHWNASVFLYKMKDFNYQFSSLFIADQIDDYLNPGKGVCYLNRILCPEPVYKSKVYDNEVYFGIECYNLLHIYIQKLIKKKALPDIRSFCLLEDHKYLMKIRFQYMLDNGYIKECDLVKKGLDKIWEDSRILRNMFLKAQIKKDKKIFQKIDNLLYEIGNNERVIFTEFYQHIIYNKLEE